MSSERQALTKNNPWWGEHLFRYKFVQSKINRNNCVLDIACGNGYGTDIIAKLTKNIVVGADISKETVVSCKQLWNKNKNVSFLVADSKHLPFPNNYFDIIVSHETIEHIIDYKKALIEFNRILKKNGTLFLSTPNIDITSPDGVVRNPFHVFEFTYDELKIAMNNFFSNPVILGQFYKRYYGKTTFNYKISEILEKLLLMRGIRKIPLYIKNIITQRLISNNFLPNADDFILVNEKRSILKCPNFYVIAKKKII